MDKPQFKTCSICGNLINDAKDGRPKGKKTLTGSPDDRYRCPSCGVYVDRPLGFQRLEQVE